MRRLRTWSLLAALSLLVACGEDEGNPFDQFSLARAPSEDAELLYVSGAWAESPGAPPELYAVNGDGSLVERLTTCTQTETPCRFMSVAVSSDPARIVAVRGAVGADPLASALFFMDLSRSVETIIAPARRVQGADWALDDSFLVYSTGDVENLWFVRPNGDEDRPLTQSPNLRERSPRLDPSVSFVAYEALRETPGKSGIFLFLGESNASFALTEGGPGSEPLEGTPYIVGSDADPVFSPNGQFIAFRRLTGTGNGGLGTWDILIVNTNDEEDIRPVVTGGGVFRGAPDWALDGRLAFVETDAEEGMSRLISILPDGTDRKVIHSEDASFGMASPRWLRPLPPQ